MLEERCMILHLDATGRTVYRWIAMTKLDAPREYLTPDPTHRVHCVFDTGRVFYAAYRAPGLGRQFWKFYRCVLDDDGSSDPVWRYLEIGISNLEILEVFFHNLCNQLNAAIAADKLAQYTKKEDPT